MLGQIFRYAISTGRISVNPAADLAGALPPANFVHHAAITEPKAVGAGSCVQYRITKVNR